MFPSLRSHKGNGNEITEPYSLLPVDCILQRIERPDGNGRKPLVLRQGDLEALLSELDLSNANIERI